MNNPIYSLREKISANNYVLRRGQNLVPLQIGDILMDYFTKSESLLFMLVTNSSCIKKKVLTHY